MYRIAIASLIVVVGLGVILVAGGIIRNDAPAAAQSDADAASEEFVPLRPGQIEDPGEPRFGTSGWATDFHISAVPYSEIVPVLPRDRIPALDDPMFESLEAARGWLDGKAPVIALEIDGDARAYPLAILTWHEIANDVVGGVPVAVTFCPLCHTALVYDRELDGTVYDFGVSGNLRFSDLVMFDRQTDSWWQQATGQGIVGDLTGAKLPFRASQLIGLDQFAEAYPDGVVMSRDTGHLRNYGVNPYPGYDSSDERPFLFYGVVDGRVAPTERVVTLGEDGSEAISFPYTELRKTGVAEIELEGRPLAVLWAPGAVSAMDRSIIDDSEDIGSTGVFSRVLDGDTLTFVRDGGEDVPITDVETGSSWDITGRALAGPLEGAALEPVPHGDHFWFAWAAFVPDTEIWTADGIVSLDGEA